MWIGFRSGRSYNHSFLCCTIKIWSQCQNQSRWPRIYLFWWRWASKTFFYSNNNYRWIEIILRVLQEEKGGVNNIREQGGGGQKVNRNIDNIIMSHLAIKSLTVCIMYGVMSICQTLNSRYLYRNLNFDFYSFVHFTSTRRYSACNGSSSSAHSTGKSNTSSGPEWSSRYSPMHFACVSTISSPPTALPFCRLLHFCPSKNSSSYLYSS